MAPFSYKALIAAMTHRDLTIAIISIKIVTIIEIIVQITEL